MMKQLNFSARGDGSHWGLSDWYPENEAALQAALDAQEPFDTGWYGSKKEIASARIRSEDGIKIKVDVSVSDDFDTEGRGYESTDEWSLEGVAHAVSRAWEQADADQDDNQPFDGFTVGRNGAWEETYLLSDDTFDTPPGDNYYWWGWQHNEDDGVGVPDPEIPLPAVAAFENWAQRWMWGQVKEDSMTIGAWTIRPWRKAPRQFDDPNDYVGMGWVGADGRP